MTMETMTTHTRLRVGDLVTYRIGWHTYHGYVAHLFGAWVVVELRDPNGRAHSRHTLFNTRVTPGWT